MKKVIAKFVVILTLVLTIGSLCLLFTACDKAPKVPVFEMKLYDDDWKELEKDSMGLYKDITKTYDGERKLCNAIVYKDGEEFYRLDYKNDPYFYKDYVLEVTFKPNWSDWTYTAGGENGFPVKRGEYYLDFEYSDEQNQSLNYFVITPLPYKYRNDRKGVRLIIE